MENRGPIEREETSGRFAKGNKSGGRKPMPPEMKELLAAATPKAAQRLIEALDAIDLGEPDHEMRVKAANAILDRIYGKPAQAVVGDDGGPLRIDIGVVDILKKLSDDPPL
jgi:hypothetical protein